MKFAPCYIHENDFDPHKAHSSPLNEKEERNKKTQEREDNHEAEESVQTEEFLSVRNKEQDGHKIGHIKNEDGYPT